MIKLDFIQDLASPHNNVLIKAVEEASDIDIDLWYCNEKPTQYNWTKDLTNEIKEANIYKPRSVDWDFLKHCLTHKKRKYLIVGWANINTRLLFILFWLLRRPYNVWFDFPQDGASRNPLKKFLREFFYFILNTSKAKVFCVGKMTIDYFKNRGFDEKRLVNMPIFVDISKTKKDYISHKAEIHKQYNVQTGQLLLSAGSRLVYDKGFDVLIDAIALLPKEQQQQLKCVIVGKGEEQKNLQHQITKHNLEDIIIMEEWLEFDDFQALIAVSDILIHPCRFDAFGATIFAHALGTAAIGSVGAGAAFDRIVDGENGYLYENDDPQALSDLLVKCLDEKDSLAQLGEAGRKTAEQWAPAVGNTILKENLI